MKRTLTLSAVLLALSGLCLYLIYTLAVLTALLIVMFIAYMIKEWVKMKEA